MTQTVDAGHRRLGVITTLVRVPLVLVASVALQLETVLFTFFAFPKEYAYGAPIPIGICHQVGLFAWQSGCDLSWMAFGVDVLATALVLGACVVFGGLGGLALGVLFAAILVRVFPRAPDGAPLALPLWLTAMVVSLVAAAGWSALRRRMAMRTRPSLRP